VTEKLSVKEWGRIVGTILIFSTLGLLFAETSLSLFSERSAFPWVLIAYNFFVFLLVAILFHLYAIRKGISSFNAYIGAGGLLGVLSAFLMFSFIGNADMHLNDLLIMSFLYGFAAGNIYSYSFWAFIVSKGRKHK